MYHEKGADYANKTINERINTIWEEMQAEHKKELAYPGLRKARCCGWLLFLKKSVCLLRCF